jgi:Zn-dependent protease
MPPLDLWNTLDMLPGIIAGLSVHEAAHAWTAWRLGDRTARDQGRVTLNPLQHIDILGLVFIVLAGFGWAKPVLFDEGRLRRPRRDVALIALAGPFANALLALALSAAYAASRPGLAGGSLAASLSRMLLLGVSINWGLFVFNLIPLPPLDGSHLVFGGLRKNPELYAKASRIGSYALFGLLIVSNAAGGGIPFIGDAVRFLMDKSLSLFAAR